MSYRDKGELWINPLSPRADRMRESAMARAFGGFHDPHDLEQKGEVFIADCEIDRRDTDGVKRFLQQKYATAPLDNMHVGRMTATYFFSEDE